MKDKLYQLLEQNKLKEVFIELNQIFSETNLRDSNPELFSQFTILNAKFTLLNRKRLEGNLISENEFNSISENLLDVIQSYDPPEPW